MDTLETEHEESASNLRLNDAVVLVADDDELARESVGQALRLAGATVVTVLDGAEALQVLRTRTVHVVVTDINMPGNANLELFDAPELVNGQASVILITGSASLETAINAVRRRAYDYLTKPFKPSRLVETVRSAYLKRREEQLQAHIVQAASALAELQSATSPSERRRLSIDCLDQLSVREQEVATLVADGQSVDGIAQHLFISRHTVRNHLRAIYSKLGVGSSTELVVKLLGS